jgi:proteasome lid subunit RPN8/RPN11
MRSFANYQMPENSRQDAERHALQSPEREVCGFIYPDHYVPLTNLAANPNTFIADPAEVAKALARYGEPMAIFHSHPGGSPNPSEDDLRLASYYNSSIIIIGTFINGRLELSQGSSAAAARSRACSTTITVTSSDNAPPI